MARVYNASTERVTDTGTEERALATLGAFANDLIGIGNDNFTLSDVVTVTQGTAYRAYLQFRDYELYIILGLRKSSSNVYLEIGCARKIGGEYVDIYGLQSNESASSYYGLRYAQVDDALFCINIKPRNKSGGSVVFRFFSVADAAFVNVYGASYGSHFSPLMAGGTYSSIGARYHDVKTLDGPSLTGGDQYFLYYNVSNTNAQLLTGEAILLPTFFYCNVGGGYAGRVKWKGHENETLYGVFPPNGRTSSFDPAANYIINGVPYKACGEELFVFL